MATWGLTLSLLPDVYAVVRLDPSDAWPTWALEARGLVAIVRTEDELSVVCPADAVPQGPPSRGGWRALKVHGPLPFDTVGVLAELAGLLARAAVSVLAVSTYDTDYLLVLEEQLAAAVAALSPRHRLTWVDDAGRHPASPNGC